MVVVNSQNYATFLHHTASIIASRVLTPINKMGVSNKNTTILSKWASVSSPLQYWAKAFQTTCYLINCLPTPVLNNDSPFQKLFPSRPNYNFMRVFGCACWPHLRPYNYDKLDFHSTTCIFIGYSPSYRGYKCLHLPT